MAADDDLDLPEPEPKEIDEKNWFRFQDLCAPRGAQGAPVRGQGEVRQLSLLPRSRSGDLVLLAPAARVLVGENWWCQWWEAVPEE